MISMIFTSALVFLTIKHCAAVRFPDNVSFGSTRGCDPACQKECIDVINKYRLNHKAKDVKFSQFLANKAQKWADGGRFGYDMKSRGKYGQLIEWDVKDELQNFTTVIKHWHDKERDFDFASGRSKTGKTLHDFTQIVWKKAKKAGCGESEIFGSKYYVVWMDSDGIISPDMEAGVASIGSPEKVDLHWFEPAKESSKSKSIHVVPLRPQDEDSSTRANVAPIAPMVISTGQVRSEQSKPINYPDLNEVGEEQRVLNNNALLKQYLYNDNLNKVVLNENKETASYHVVPGAEENANWQKGAESLVQLEKNKANSSQTSPNNGITSYPVGEREEEDGKQAARFQSLVIQDDDMLTKDEGDADNATLSSEANDGDEIGEGEENQQAATIQSLMKQEDDMIQNQEAEEEDESSGGSSKVEETPSETPNDTNTVNSNNTAYQQREKPSSYYASGVALNNNPNETNVSISSNDKPSIGSPEDSNSSSSLPSHGMINQSSINSQQGTPSGSSSQGSLTIEQNEDKGTGVMEPSSQATGIMEPSRQATGSMEPSSQATGIMEPSSQATATMDPSSQGTGIMEPSNLNNKQNEDNAIGSMEPSSQATDIMEPSSQATGIMKPSSLNNKQNEDKAAGAMEPANLNIEHNEVKGNGVMQPSSTSSSQHDKSGNQMAANVSQSIILNHDDKMANHATTIQQPESTGGAVTGSTNTGSNVGNDGGKVVTLASSPTVLSSQGQKQTGGMPMVSNSQSRLTLTDMIVPGRMTNSKGKSQDVSQSESTSAQPQQSGSPSVNQHPISTASSSLKNEDSTLILNTLPPSGQATGTNAAIQSPVGNAIKASASVSDVHHVNSPAVITLPSASSRPIKLVFHVQDMKSKGMTSNDAPVSGSQVADGYQTTSVFNDVANNMNSEECHDDTLQCQLWAHHGHCKGIAYAGFMKRHCKATCGYCGLPSVFKESANHIQTHSLAQDEPCEDNPSYEFSCPRWQAQGYCEKRPKLMKLVCRRACGFCDPVTNRAKSRLSTTLKLSPEISQAGPELGDKSTNKVQAPTPSKPSQAGSELGYKNTGEVQAPTLSKPFSSSPPEPKPNAILNNPAKFTPASEVQTINITPLQPKIFLSQLYKPFGNIKQNASLSTKNTTEASGTSAPNSPKQRANDKAGSLPLKNQDEKPEAVGSKNASDSKLKSSGPTMSQNNKTTLPDQMGLKTPSSLPRGQGVTDKLNNFIKPPVNIGLTSLSVSKPQLAFLPINKKVSYQDSGSEEEDKMIQDGIKALQHRLQAPLEISAVAKSSAGCKERLCKEKVKTQQAKTRETIGSQVPDVSFASKTAEKPVSTTGCNISCQQECLAAHNRYRLNHGASPLILDQTLADQAQQWADKKLFKHSPWAGGQGGETIALGSLYPSFTAAIKAWHDEEKDYDWSTGTGNRDMKVNHFTQVVWKGAHVLGCGKTLVNGEPYYIAQMDTPGVIASVPGYDKSNVGEPKEPDLMWFMDSSPYWKEMQAKDAIPKNIEHRIL